MVHFWFSRPSFPSFPSHLLATLTATLALAGNAGAAGMLDPAFGTSGRVTVAATGTASATARRAAMQSDGKIVVAGSAFNGANLDFAVLRFFPNGALDETFGSGGMVLTPVGTGDNHASAVTIQPDGLIVVAGYAMNGTKSDFALARYLPDGSLDASFATGGVARIAVTAGNDAAAAVGLQSDGKIVAAGTVGGGITNAFGVVRLNADGSLDDTYNSTGKVTAAINGINDQASALAVQADDKVVVAGSAFSGPHTVSAVARFTGSGALDATFGSGGKVTAQFGLHFASLGCVAIQADGRIVGAGTANDGIGGAYFVLLRLTTAGVLDTSFNTVGTATMSFGPNSSNGATSVLIQPDGKIVAGGTVGLSGAQNFGVGRFNGNGTVDTGFNSTGQATVSFGAGSDLATDGLLQADGRIVLAGTPSGTAGGFALARFSSAGALDPSLNGAGTVAVTGIGRAGATGNAIVVAPDGKIVVGGTRTAGGIADQVLVARLMPDGSLDPTFNGTGMANAPAQSSFGRGQALAVQPDGKVVVAGHAGPLNFGFWRFTAAGTLDAAFGTGGMVQGNTGMATEWLNAVAVQPDGKVVGAGHSFLSLAGNDTSFLLVRRNTDGTPDTGFATAGATRSAIATGTNADAAHALALQSDGSIIAAGYAHNGANNDFAIARFSTGGVIQASQRLDVQAGASDVAYAVAIQADGKILVGGSSGTQSALVRLDSVGALDGSFAAGGIFLEAGSAIRGITLQADGGILAVTESFKVFRLDSTGAPDYAFGTGGSVYVAFAGAVPVARAIAIQPDARVIVAGDAGVPEARQLAVARVIGADAAPARRRGDANGDGKSDLFWRTAVPGTGLSWWTMDGAVVTAASYHDVDAAWQVADVGDLDGDGKADLVWRRTTDGATYLWLLDGFAFKGFADLGVLDPAAWSLAGTGDLDGDGKDDVVWRGADGTVYAWLMNGGTIASQGVISNPGTAWVIADLADMDGDGKADIVFRNPTDGGVYAYFMNGLAIASGGLVGIVDPAEWTLAAAADFSGDGKADILWRHTSGDPWVWIMNGGAFVSAGGIGNPGTGWSVRSLGDFDGDGKVDLVWRHTDGTTYLWKMDGAAVSAVQPLPSPGGTWQVVAP